VLISLLRKCSLVITENLALGQIEKCSE